MEKKKEETLREKMMRLPLSMRIDYLKSLVRETKVKKEKP
jgi:hypothetical protein